MNKNSGTTNLVRPAFGPGMLLQHQDLELLTSYTRDLSRMLFKSFFGCGVVCGLTVTVKPDCGQLKITVEPGVALTCSGDPVAVSDRLEFYAEKEDSKPPLYVVLCSHTKHFGPRAPMCETDGESSPGVCTREIDCYKVIVKKEIKGDCGCPGPQGSPAVATPAGAQGAAKEIDCYEDHKAGKCGCACGDCADAGSGCIVLAALVLKPRTPQGQDIKDEWMANHSVRRFIRPALLPDKQAEADRAALKPRDKPDTGTTRKPSAGNQKPPAEPLIVGTPVDVKDDPAEAGEAKTERAVKDAKGKSNKPADKSNE